MLHRPSSIDRQRVPLGKDSIVQQATSIRRVQDAMEQPTIAQVIAGNDRITVVACAGMMLTAAMEYFSTQRRMSSGQIAFLADIIVDDYPHESLADVNVFLRGVASGKYCGDGETYGALDVQRFRGWFANYLEEKAMHRERHADVEDQPFQECCKALLSLPGVGELVDGIRAERHEKAANESIIRLREQIPMMSDDELRQAWSTSGIHGRAYIHAEAARRGLYGEEVKAAQLEHDAEQERRKAQRA